MCAFCEGVSGFFVRVAQRSGAGVHDGALTPSDDKRTAQDSQGTLTAPLRSVGPAPSTRTSQKAAHRARALQRFPPQTGCPPPPQRATPS